MIEKVPTLRSSQESKELKRKDGVSIETLWKAQSDVASQWELVRKLQRLAAKAKNAENSEEPKTSETEHKLQVLKDKLAARIIQEEEKLDNAFKARLDLFDWPANESQASDPTLVQELERELEQ